MIDGAALPAINSDPYTTFVVRTVPSRGRVDSTLMIIRTRYVGQRMREDIAIHDFGEEPTLDLLEGFIDADCTDFFAVKEEHSRRSPCAARRVRSRRAAQSTSWCDGGTFGPD